MSDDLYLTLGQVSSRLPGARGAKRVSLSTIARWIVGGCPSRTGERVRLTATRAGGRWLVRESDLAEFFHRLAGEPSSTPPPPRSPVKRAKAAEAAGRELTEKHGV